ncbi:VC2046/SO_2500 family protein [Shewanella youngdeokensis]|uniref:VC2046/SO_2500 family protein n=1 Tax=Shewanella youngdeokensis TaxID=2999068 RepID=A0ABZ0K2B0_9GAMM|nr:VC2046/SO_2500 family protein [Shewanella sp. DAU334]
MQAISPLVNELQLGSRLNSAIGASRRGEFALLLSLLSADARDLAQFQTAEFKQADLRAKFNLAEAQPLLNRMDTDDIVTDNSAMFQIGGEVGFRLANALNQEALVIRRNESLDLEDVLNNCELNTRLRYQNTEVKQQTVQLKHFADTLVEQRQMSELIAQA